MKKKIIVSVVCYYNENEVIKFAKQLSKQTASNEIKLVITCNGSNKIENFKKDLLEIPLDILLNYSEINLGYLKGCLSGLSVCKDEYEWALICNTDIEFCEDIFFERVIEEEIDKKIWVWGPDILKVSGEIQNPFLIQRPSKRYMHLRKKIYSNFFFFNIFFILSSIKAKLLKNKAVKKTSMQVYSVHGCAFFINKACITELNLEINNIFMYGEEIYISEIVNKNNKCVFFNDKYRIIHNENQVTGLVTNKRKQEWFKDSMEFLCTTFF